MRIIIHYKEESLFGGPDFLVSHVSSLKTLTDMYPKEDIEGEIRPSARKNPELENILIGIWEQKHRLWMKDKIRTEQIINYQQMLVEKFDIHVPL